MSTAYQTISSFKSLNDAWTKLWNESRPKSRDTYGIDGESLNDFSKNSVANLHLISKRLRNNTYTHSALKPHFVTKPNGKIRVICIPSTTDRIVQGALLKYLSERYTPRFSNDVSYGFLKNRSVKKALLVAQSKRKSNPWVFKTDIKAFFDNIQRNDLKKKIKSTVRERSLHNLLEMIVDCEIAPTTKTEKRNIALLGIRDGLGVRQGMPLSPFFSNIVLENFDKAVTRTGYSALRYADDLIFFSPNKKMCTEIEEFCKRELIKVGLEIPPSGIDDSKSVIYKPSEDADFLGLSLSLTGNVYQIKVAKKQILSIVNTFKQLSSIEELLARKITLAKLGAHLRARKSGYIHAYDLCSNITELEHTLDDIEQKILKKLYTVGLGIDLGKISHAAYTFLGLR